jgi:hypothetical protein
MTQPNHKNKNSNSGFNFDEVFAVSERELVNPKLSRYDKTDLYSLLLEDLREFVDKNQIAPYNQQSEIDFEANVEKIFPKYMLYDTYNINVTPTEAMQIAKTDESNKWLFDFLMNKATDYYMKAVTQSSPFNSYVYTSEIVQQLLLLYQQQNPQGPDPNDSSGDGQSGMEKMLSKMMGNAKGNQQLDQAIQKAQDNAENKIESTENTGEASGELGSDKGMGDFSLGELSEFMDYQEAIKHIKLDSQMVNNFIKTTLNLSKTYFSSKYKEFQVEMLEADVIDDLQGLENLHPQLRALHLDQVVTHDRYYHMKFDVYFDISGSMASNMYGYNVSETGKQTQYSISGLDMAKITAIKLRNLNYVEDVYPFQSRVEPKLDDNHKIALVRCTGGTDIDAVIRNITKTGRPSVVITDMQDNISLYDPNVYFIGILGAAFSEFKRSPVGKQYLSSHQCVKYTDNNNFEIVI